MSEVPPQRERRGKWRSAAFIGLFVSAVALVLVRFPPADLAG